eukprot:jgi/Botrbrau1/16058/Bobra.7_2s0032.1
METFLLPLKIFLPPPQACISMGYCPLADLAHVFRPSKYQASSWERLGLTPQKESGIIIPQIFFQSAPVKPEMILCKGRTAFRHEEVLGNSQTRDVHWLGKYQRTWTTPMIMNHSPGTEVPQVPWVIKLEPLLLMKIRIAQHEWSLFHKTFRVARILYARLIQQGLSCIVLVHHIRGGGVPGNGE